MYPAWAAVDAEALDQAEKVGRPSVFDLEQGVRGGALSCVREATKVDVMRKGMRDEHARRGMT